MVGQPRNNIPFKSWQSFKGKKSENKKWGQFYDHPLQNDILLSLPHTPWVCQYIRAGFRLPSFFPFLAGKDKRHETFPLFFFHLWQILWRRDGEGRRAFFLQLPSNQNKAAALQLRDHLCLKDLNSRGAIFEAPKMNVRRGHQMRRTVMHAQPAKSCSQHLISCVCYLLSFSLFFTYWTVSGNIS